MFFVFMLHKCLKDKTNLGTGFRSMSRYVEDIIAELLRFIFFSAFDKDKTQSIAVLKVIAKS